MRYFRRKTQAVSSVAVGLDEDAVWNRAAVGRGGSSPRDGDRALADLLQFHSIAMNGGCLHAYQFLSRDAVDAAVRGYRFFGLHDAAAAVEWFAAEAAAADLENDDAAERLEVEAQDRYDRAVPTDSTLAVAFKAAYRRAPDAFAPPER